MPIILETLVATLDAAGRPNVAPMGITPQDDRIVLRPFAGGATWRNLRECGEGVAHFDDDVLTFARCALTPFVPPHRPATRVRGVILEDACHWREFVVESSDLSEDRARFVARVVATGRGRDFAGLNRARHAVLEATIRATRLHLTGKDPVLEEIARLRPLVEKTGGPAEHEALAFVAAHVAAWERPGER
jgi:hypothetical protein